MPPFTGHTGVNNCPSEEKEMGSRARVTFQVTHWSQNSHPGLRATWGRRESRAAFRGSRTSAQASVMGGLTVWCPRVCRRHDGGSPKHPALSTGRAIWGWSPGPYGHQAPPTRQPPLLSGAPQLHLHAPVLMCFLCSSVLEKVLSQELHWRDESLEDRWF